MTVASDNVSSTITYEANMATQRKALSDEQIANVVFKMGWSGQSIKEYDVVPLEDILRDDGTAYLQLGKSVQLNAIALYAEGETEWTSSNRSVVTIDENGFATAVTWSSSNISLSWVRVSKSL